MTTDSDVYPVRNWVENCTVKIDGLHLLFSTHSLMMLHILQKFMKISFMVLKLYSEHEVQRGIILYNSILSYGICFFFFFLFFLFVCFFVLFFAYYLTMLNFFSKFRKSISKGFSVMKWKQFPH